MGAARKIDLDSSSGAKEEAEVSFFSTLVTVKRDVGADEEDCSDEMEWLDDFLWCPGLTTDLVEEEERFASARFTLMGPRGRRTPLSREFIVETGWTLADMFNGML